MNTKNTARITSRFVTIEQLEQMVHEATFEHQVRLSEKRTERIEAARKATAAFLGNDNGEIIFV